MYNIICPYLIYCHIYKVMKIDVCIRSIGIMIKLLDLKVSKDVISNHANGRKREYLCLCLEINTKEIKLYLCCEIIIEKNLVFETKHRMQKFGLCLEIDKFFFFYLEINK